MGMQIDLDESWPLAGDGGLFLLVSMGLGELVLLPLSPLRVMWLESWLFCALAFEPLTICLFITQWRVCIFLF